MNRSAFWTQLCGIKLAEDVNVSAAQHYQQQYSKSEHQLITIVSGGTGAINGPNDIRPKRFNTRSLSPRFCLSMVVTVAFVIGIVIGILLSSSKGPNSLSSSSSSSRLLLPLLSSSSGGEKSVVGWDNVTPSAPVVLDQTIHRQNAFQKDWNDDQRVSSVSVTSFNQSEQRTQMEAKGPVEEFEFAQENVDEIVRTFSDVMAKYRWWPFTVTDKSEMLIKINQTATKSGAGVAAATVPRANQRPLMAAAALISTPKQKREKVEDIKAVNSSNKRQIVVTSNVETTPNSFTTDNNNLRDKSERLKMMAVVGRSLGTSAEGGATMLTVDPPTTTQQQAPPPDFQNNSTNIRETSAELADNASVERLVSDGVFWSPEVEASLPAGFAEEDNWLWTTFADQVPVVKVLDGCGRMQNRLLVFENGTKACSRYRQNNDQIQGEIFSFYLAHLLGLKNLPPATLGLLFGRDWQWHSVRGQLTLAQWNEQKPVVMTKFVDDLVPAFIPKQFRTDDRHLHPTPADLSGLSREQVLELAQWSDLVIFDYLTANLDRIVNNMYNKQWNPDMMDSPAHNLAKVSSSGLLVFLDNESGLLHGYRLLDKYESYHRATLNSLCVFRRSTVQAIRALRGSNDAAHIGKVLKESLKNRQPYMMDWLPLLPDKSLKILRERLARVEQQVTDCEQKFGYNSDEELIETLTKPMMPTATQ